MSVSETRIAARDTSGVDVYYQHSTLPTKENVEAYEAFHKGAASLFMALVALAGTLSCGVPPKR